MILDPSQRIALMRAACGLSRRRAWSVLTTAIVRGGRFVLPPHDGDPPDEPVGARYPRQYQRDELTDALMDRVDAWNRRVATAVRDTHRDVHRALAGDTTGCRWCNEVRS